MPRARKKAESGRKIKIQKQEEEEKLRLTLEAEMSLPGCMSLPPPEPAKMLSWVEPWREECSLAVIDSQREPMMQRIAAKPENELPSQLETPSRPCQTTRTPGRPAATATSPGTLPPTPRTCVPSPPPETTRMTAKPQSARAGKLPWAPAWQDTMPAASPPTPGTASLPGKQPFTATTTMPEQAGAVAKMREKMPGKSSSLGVEKPGIPFQQAKTAFANLIAKFESEPSPIKMPKAPKFLSQCAQQPVRLPIARPSLHEQLPSPQASTSASQQQNERENLDSLLAAQNCPEEK
jgi:hypothetical protein